MQYCLRQYKMSICRRILKYLHNETVSLLQAAERPFSLWINPALPVTAEEDAVIHIFVRF